MINEDSIVMLGDGFSRFVRNVRRGPEQSTSKRAGYTVLCVHGGPGLIDHSELLSAFVPTMFERFGEKTSLAAAPAKNLRTPCITPSNTVRASSPK